MKLISLQSGSNGNCIYVESDEIRLLFDAGISGKKAQQRLADRDIDIRDVTGLLISHDHADHVGCAGIYNRKFGLPVHMTRSTLFKACSLQGLGKIADIRHFSSGQTLSFGHVTVETLPTPHDGVDGVAFVVSARGKRLGVMTDLGHVTEALESTMMTLDAVLIESNFDPHMLETGSYPRHVKRRIEGPGGHLSNVETAQLIRRHASHLQWACLGHLSERNNTPNLALSTCREIVGESLPIHLAGRYESSAVLII